MDKGYKSIVRPSYRLLNEEQIREIYLATLDILESVGVQVRNVEGVHLLREAGCRVEGEDIVHIPNRLVEECIRSAPKRVTVYSRTGKEAMRLEGRNNYFGLGTDLVYTWDLYTGELRPSRLQDVANAARLVDACKDIDFTASYALPEDVPVNSMYLYCVKAMMENTTKPIFFTAGGKEDLAFIFEMAGEAVGGMEALQQRPFLVHYSEPTAPLMHSYGAVNKLFLCADHGIPICYPPGSLMGGGSPVTLAGAVVQANAEALSGIVLHQMRRKGAPIISGWYMVPMDMKSTAFCYGAPESRLTNSAFADMFHFYGLPMWSSVGSDAHSMDEQAAYENMTGTLLSALDGANLIHDLGYIGQGKTASPAMIVMGDEQISYVRRLLRGFELSWEKTGLDVIRKVGPGGHYLTEQHTLDHFREEQWRPRLADRDMLEVWREKGARSYRQAAEAKARRILETHLPLTLEPEVQERVNAVVERADKVLGSMEFTA